MTVRGYMVKNKIDPANRQSFKIPVHFKGGIMQLWCAREFLDTLGLITSRGSYRMVSAISRKDKFQDGTWPKYAKKYARQLKALIRARIAEEAVRTKEALQDADIDSTPDIAEFAEDE